MNDYGANGFTAEELEELFREDDQQETPPADNNIPQSDDGNSNTGNGTDDSQVDTTKVFAKRLKESTAKAVSEERERIAKSLGYESYADMEKKRENDIYAKNGLNPEDVSPIVDQLIKARLENDPRMKELSEYRNREVQEFGKKELAELTKITDGAITSLSQVPKEVIQRWSESGSLVKAYMELEGVNLLTKLKSSYSKGTTSHMNTPSGSSAPSKKQRHLTEEEKRAWRLFHPNMTEEQLNNKMINEGD